MRAYERYLRYLEEYLGELQVLRHVDLAAAEDFQEHLRDVRRLATSSVNDGVSVARSVFRYAVKLGWLSSSPFDVLVDLPPANVQQNRAFTPDEVRKLIQTARKEFPWFVPALVTAAFTGVRRSELCSFRVGDYDSAAGILTLRAECAKGGRQHAFLLPASARKLLDDIIVGRHADAPLFCNQRRQPLSAHSFDVFAAPPEHGRRVWRRLLYAAGVVPRGIHNLRRAVVTNLAEAGFSVDQAVALTGHTPEIARRHYLTRRLEAQVPLMEHLERIYLDE